MIDTVIKGTGNSRSIKAPMTLPAAWEDARTQLVSEGWPIDLGPLNLAGLLQKGTDLNKENLLTDNLCEALGLDTTATPNEAMDKLRTLISTSQSTAEGKANVQVGSYTGNGTSGINGPKTLNFSFSPKLVVVTAVDKYLLIIVAVRNATFLQLNGGSYGYGQVATWGDNSLSWYVTDGREAVYQLNKAGQQYTYVAIG